MHQTFLHGRGLWISSICDLLKMIFHKYLKKFNWFRHNTCQWMKQALFRRFVAGFLAAKCVFCDFWAFLAMLYLEFSTFSKMNIQTVKSSWFRVKWAPEIVYPIKVGKKVTLVVHTKLSVCAERDQIMYCHELVRKGGLFGSFGPIKRAFLLKGPRSVWGTKGMSPPLGRLGAMGMARFPFPFDRHYIYLNNQSIP